MTEERNSSGRTSGILALWPPWERYSRLNKRKFQVSVDGNVASLVLLYYAL